MVGYLESAFTVREVSGLIPEHGGHKIFADVGDPLTTLISTGLSKDSGSILKHDGKPTFFTNAIHF